MKTPEEIKKGLEICGGYDCRGCPYDGTTFDNELYKCDNELYNDALAYIQQLEQRLVEVNKTSPRWISVKEREPKRLQRALVYSPVVNRIASGVYTEVGFITQAVMGKITHWMEIPEPPKEDKNVT